MKALFAKAGYGAVLACAIMFALLCLREASVTRFPLVPLDEQGHVSYAYHLVQTREFFPNLAAMRLFDFDARVWSGNANFINHPPLGYHLLNLVPVSDPVGPSVRAGSVLLFSLGFATILLGLSATGRFSNLGLAFVTCLCILLKLHRFGAVFSNDSVAFLGGALAFYGSILFLKAGHGGWNLRAGLIAGTIGAALCLAAKLNAAILVGAYLVTVMAIKADRLQDRFAKWMAAAAVAVCCAAAWPYLSFLFEYGSPAPETPGQIAMISAASGSARMELPVYVYESIRAGLGNAGPDAFATYAVFGLITACSMVWHAFAPGSRAKRQGLDTLARAALAATVLTLAVHLAFSYQRHLAYGWQPELYPRYYFPLLGPYLLLFLAAISARGPLRSLADPEGGDVQTQAN